MKQLLILLVLVVSLASCGSESGHLADNQPKQKVLVQEIFYGTYGYVVLPGTAMQVRYVDTMYAIGDTVRFNLTDYVIRRK